MPPHDALFKLALRNPESALAFLRMALSEEVLAAIDPSTLRVSDGSFVDDDLRERFADALLEVESRGEPTLIHVLFEHKSKPERFTVAHLFDSVARVWKAWIRNHDGATNLPRVLPIVFHHGAVAWNQPRDIRELLSGDPEIARIFAPFDPTFPVVFHDLGGVDDPEAAIRDVVDPLARCVTFLLVASRLRDYIEHLKRVGFALISRVSRLPNGESLVGPVLHYVFEFVPADIDPADFVDMSAQHMDPQAEKVMKSLKDVLLEQGEAKGRQEGRQEGLAEGTFAGRCEGESQAILTVLGSRLAGDLSRVRDRLFEIRDHGRLLELLVIATKVDSVEAFDRELAKG